jgi:hypothetical protein
VDLYLAIKALTDLKCQVLYPFVINLKKALAWASVAIAAERRPDAQA